MRNSQIWVETLRVAKYGNFPPVWIIDNSTVSPRWPAIKDHTKQLILDNIMVVLQGSGLYFDPRASLESLRSCVIVKKNGGSTNHTTHHIDHLPACGGLGAAYSPLQASARPLPQFHMKFHLKFHVKFHEISPENAVCAMYRSLRFSWSQ